MSHTQQKLGRLCPVVVNQLRWHKRARCKLSTRGKKERPLMYQSTLVAAYTQQAHAHMSRLLHYCAFVGLVGVLCSALFVIILT